MEGFLNNFRKEFEVELEKKKEGSNIVLKEVNVLGTEDLIRLQKRLRRADERQKEWGKPTNGGLTFAEKEVWKLISNTEFSSELISGLNRWINWRWYERIAEDAFLTEDAIIKMEEQWEKTIHVKDYYHPMDPSRKYTEIVTPLWHFLCQNPNILWTETLLKKYFDKMSFFNFKGKISISTSFFNELLKIDIRREEITRYSHHYEYSWDFRDVDMKKVLSDVKMMDVTLVDLEKNYSLWNGVLFYEGFMNDSIYQLVKS